MIAGRESPLRLKKQRLLHKRKNRALFQQVGRWK